ncbi:hypothetical protein ECE50_028725 [Chitinophaga sp. Mgbs1]|uniref:Uncharacterized protein n=1 Tax=Chitinophaga solisilvae TaxID=1233460 RepID=A0A3S1JBB7_9BACT|nr:hypothetical protein [Chitinophaga solisilvae]
MIWKTAAAIMLLATTQAGAQQRTNVGASTKNKGAITIPLQPASWEDENKIATFTTHKSVPAVILKGKGQLVLKDFNMTDGIIEYDMEPMEKTFTGIYFRRSSALESEIFYFRADNAGHPEAFYATQYAPMLSGTNMWDMYHHFQAGASYQLHQWNHVKLVISGKQLAVFVNDMEHPILQVPQLEGNSQSGSIAFDGPVAIANLMVQPGQPAGLSPLPGIDPVSNDTRYLRSWLVSQPAIIPAGTDIFSSRKYTANSTGWDTIRAERRGLINLTRKFGASKERRIVWLKTSIQANADLNKQLRLGFSDDIWIYLNGSLLLADKNTFGALIMKTPAGRCSLENTTLTLPLKKGDNELLIGVANDFYGWGIVARWDDMEEIIMN